MATPTPATVRPAATSPSPPTCGSRRACLGGVTRHGGRGGGWVESRREEVAAATGPSSSHSTPPHPIGRAGQRLAPTRRGSRAPEGGGHQPCHPVARHHRQPVRLSMRNDVRPPGPARPSPWPRLGAVDGGPGAAGGPVVGPVSNHRTTQESGMAKCTAPAGPGPKNLIASFNPPTISRGAGVPLARERNGWRVRSSAGLSRALL